MIQVVEHGEVIAGFQYEADALLFLRTLMDHGRRELLFVVSEGRRDHFLAKLACEELAASGPRLSPGSNQAVR